MDGWLNIVLIFYHILIIPEHWVLPKSRIPAQLVLGGVRIVAPSISSHEQAQLNLVCCFLILMILSISEGSVFPDNLFCVLCPV